MDKLSIRAKLLAKLIDDAALMDVASEDEESAETAAPPEKKPKVEVLELESAPEDVESEEEMPEGLAPKKASGGPKVEPVVDEEDPESLDEFGRTPAEALEEKMKKMRKE